jgi:hypothetical protein
MDPWCNARNSACPPIRNGSRKRFIEKLEQLVELNNVHSCASMRPLERALDRMKLIERDDPLLRLHSAGETVPDSSSSPGGGTPIVLSSGRVDGRNRSRIDWKAT